MNEIELKSRAERMLKRLTAMGFTKDGKPMVIDQAYELVAAGEGLRNQHVLRVIAKKASGMDAAVATFAQGVYAAGYRPEVHIPPLVIPRLPDDGFIEAVLVEHGPHDDGDIAFAFEQWRLILEEAAKRASVEPITPETEQSAERTWVGIVNQLQMDDREEILHLEGFIRAAGLMGELAKYAARVAAEQGETISSTFVDQASAAPSAGRVTPTAANKGSTDSVSAFLGKIGFEVKDSDFHRPFWECGDVGSEDFDTEAEAWHNAYSTALETAALAMDLNLDALLALPEGERMKAVERFNPRTLGEMTKLLSKCRFEFTPAGKRGSYQWRYLHDVFSKGFAPSLQRAVVQAWQYAKEKVTVSEEVFDAMPFEAQLVLVESAYLGGSKVAAVDQLAEEKRCRALADEAYENFDFRGEVVESNGWESCSGTGRFRRAVFLATIDGEDTRKVIFEVQVNGDAVTCNVSNS